MQKEMPAALHVQIVDFDGESLRRTLPAIVKTLHGALSAGGRVSTFPPSMPFTIMRMLSGRSVWGNFQQKLPQL